MAKQGVGVEQCTKVSGKRSGYQGPKGSIGERTAIRRLKCFSAAAHKRGSYWEQDGGAGSDIKATDPTLTNPEMFNNGIPSNYIDYLNNIRTLANTHPQNN
jgi:hypothetical protein